jgi:hypothetical protein
MEKEISIIDWFLEQSKINNYIQISENAHWLIDEAKEMEKKQTFDIMQQYASFCVKCDREKLPLLFAKEWFEKFKK